MHLQRRAVPSDNACAALSALHAHDLAEDLLVKSHVEQDREAVLGHSHLILVRLHRSVKTQNLLGGSLRWNRLVLGGMVA